MNASNQPEPQSTDDLLLARLAAADPAHPAVVAIHPADSTSAQLLKESIMSTPQHLHPTSSGDTSDAHHTRSVRRAEAEHEAHGPRRGRLAWLVGGVGLATGGGALALATLGGGSPVAATSISLDGSSGGGFDSCLPVADIVPEPGTIAFGGVVVAIDGEQVTIDVSEWFVAGPDGEVDQVVINGDAAGSPALDGVELRDGQQVLVSAAAGGVLGCGMSGDDTPQLRDIFGQWYPG